MSDTQIATYSAGFKFEIDRASINRFNAQVNRLKKNIETKLGSLNITGLKINIKELNKSLSQASTKIVLPISNFSINATALRQQVQAAFGRGVSLRVNATGTGSTAGPRASGVGRGSGVERLAQFGSRAIPAIAGFAGLANINRISQEISSGRMSLNTVSQGRGVDAFDWIRKNSNQMGVNYMEALPAFNNYIASSINKQGYDNTLQSYKDITSFGLTRGATNESMGRANYAIGQMWSQGKVKSEELNLQLSEAKGFGGVKELFAQAYQESIGGALTGQKAEAALAAAMKKGTVLTKDVLPIVTRLMGEQSKAGIGAYQTSTAAAQNRFSNATTDAIDKFSRAGFSASMARFFNMLTKGLEESDGLIRQLGAGFNTLIIFMEALLNVGSKVFKLINDINPALSLSVAVLLPLAKIVGGTGLAFLGLALALDDISGYIHGKDSVFGSFMEYMRELTGFDWQGIATGFGVIGVAILAAFAPITALAMSIGALVIAYDYLQNLKKKEAPIVATSTSLPTYAQMNAQNQRLADEAWTANPSISTGWTAANVSIGNFFSRDSSFSGGVASRLAGVRKGSPAFLKKLRESEDQGIISSEEVDRVLSAMGTGASNPSAMESWLTKRTTFNPNVSGNENANFRIGVVNVTANDKIEFVDSIKEASTNFGAKTTIKSTGN